MDKFRCDNCGSEDLLIVQTIGSGPIYYVCKTCKKEIVINEKLFNDMMAVYKEYLIKKGSKETAEEQGCVGCYC